MARGDRISTQAEAGTASGPVVVTTFAVQPDRFAVAAFKLHPLRASVIVRSRNERDALERALQSIRAQTVPVELVVVDSGSTDGALEVARAYADIVVEIAPGEFTYGRALNVGARAASGDVLLPLSSHCVAPHERWVEMTLAHHEDPTVAATNGAMASPSGEPLTGPFRPTLDDLAADPWWGFSNHGGSWRADVVRDNPFEEHVDACEDKIWARQVLSKGWSIVFDPALTVGIRHRQEAGMRALFRRARKEARQLAVHVDRRPYYLREAVCDWWVDVPVGGKPRPIRRLHWSRAAEVAGRWVGWREGRRIAGPTSSNLETVGSTRPRRS